MLVGGFAGPVLSGAGSIRGNSKALMYARANATSTRAVQAEMDAEALRKEAEITEDLSKKRKLLMKVLQSLKKKWLTMILFVLIHNFGYEENNTVIDDIDIVQHKI